MDRRAYRLIQPAATGAEPLFGISAGTERNRCDGLTLTDRLEASRANTVAGGRDAGHLLPAD